LLLHAVRRLLAVDCVDSVVVAAPASQLTVANTVLTPLGGRVSVIAGGGQRSDSVRLALEASTARTGDVVLVHDAARAFAPASLVRSVVAAVFAGAPAVVPVLPVTDTVKTVDAQGRILSTVDRSTLRSVQTPQGFRPDVLRRAHSPGVCEATDVTDDAGMVERLGEPVHTVPGSPLAFKITTPFDLLVAEAVARQ
jgi:2-C-methyl-D-erythritol 4-phosphate cytidylyltransferase